MVSPVVAQAILSNRTPDISGAFREGEKIAMQREDEARQKRSRELAGQALQEGGGDSLQELFSVAPELGADIQNRLGIQSGKDFDQFAESARIGEAMLGSGQVDEFINFANQRADILDAQGRNSEQTRRIASIARVNPSAAMQELRTFNQSITDVREVRKTARQQEFEQFQQMKEGPDKERFGKMIGAVSSRETPEELAAKVSAREGAKGAEERQQEAINQGVTAADSIANLNRTIDLLDKVKTGGLASANLSAQRLFGVEGADAGELSNRLGIAVLGQLKETFGAAFTAQEGERLERLSASFGKSPAANRRIIEQALKLAERKAERGIRAAEARNDTESAQSIRDAMDFSLAIEEAAPVEPAQTSQGTQVGRFTVRVK